jgi:hypothetical protein
MLDLGPFHRCVYDHIKKIIDNPDILIGKDIDPSESYKMATLDGEEWQNIEVVKKILDLIPTLPHFCNLLISFFKGAAETWEHFTSEFAPGGLIDEATVEEKELAWMPATNDENEGALGSFRHLMQYQPQLTLLSHNALAMFFRNNTQAFMAAKFTEEEDYRYLHKLAQDANGEEKKRRKELVEFHDKREAEKIVRKKVREQNAKETAERIAQLDLIFDKEEAQKLRGHAFKDQLKLFKNAGTPNLQKALPTIADCGRQAPVDAIELYADGTWKPALGEETEADITNLSGEQNEEDEDEENWEDIHRVTSDFCYSNAFSIYF